MKHTLALLAIAVTPVVTTAETYRLKFPTTVDILDGSEVVGTKKLKAGTVVSLADDAVSESAAMTKAKDSADDAKSEMPYKLFLSKRPKSGIWVRCKVELDDYYNFDFDEKKSVFQSVSIKVYRPDGQDYDTAAGYFKKATPIGKKLMPLLKDGNSHLVYAKIIPVVNRNDDACVINEFKPLKDIED